MTRVIFADRSGPRLIKANQLHDSAEQVLAHAVDRLAIALHRESERRLGAAGDLSRGIIELCAGMAQKLIQRTLQDRPDALLELMEPLVRGLRSATVLRIEAHPLDAILLRQRLNPFIPSSDDGAIAVKVEENSSLSRGSLLVDSDVGALDGRLETRLGLVARSLATTLEAKP